ncbi:cyclin-like protein [Pholiota conissans]|uniref:Cyclin-like protein n=1 Tax=Pholiota conissans TaxID=109636 RepID=A0A9P5ZE53_9AGAR|nr:cyclin-like protein [Pholiota conissans]
MPRSTTGRGTADPQSSSRAHTPSSRMPASSSKHYHPYFTPAEIEYLSEKQRGKQSATQEEKIRQSACTFLETIGARVGFPRRTIATAQALYNRFHLFFPRKDFQYYDVALAALFVSTKEHDTLKKPRELLAVAYSVRFPELAAKSKNPNGEVDIDTMDPAMVEADRQRLLAVERLILETICFNFKARMPFPYVIKLGKQLKASKKLIKLAWRMSIDSYRTLLPLIYPPHTMALGSIFAASLLLSFEQPPPPTCENETPPGEIAKLLNTDSKDGWQTQYHTRPEDLEDIAHTVLDLLIQFTSNSSANTSPTTPSSPSPNLPARDRQALAQQPQYPYKADQLLRLKIAMRETEHPPRRHKPLGNSDPSALYNNDKIGQNEGTVRFLFSPPGFESDMV